MLTHPEPLPQRLLAETIQFALHATAQPLQRPQMDAHDG